MQEELETRCGAIEDYEKEETKIHIKSHLKLIGLRG